MKKYLITGGAGFIGSHLSAELLKMGNEVVVIDDFSSGADKKVSPKLKFYKIDIEDSDKVRKIFNEERPDAVFHLAGAINLRRQITDPFFIKALNVLGRTNTILDICRESGAKKIIFVSSGGAIYENAQVIPAPENYPAHPSSLYGMANLITEKYIEIYCKNYNLDFIIPRLSNVYGPGQWESGIVPSIIIKILKKENPVIYGDGSQTRDFVYVDDAVDALVMLADKAMSGIYNVGTGKEVSLNEILKLAEGITGAKVAPEYKNLEIAETTRSALDIKKIKEKFDWRPKTSIKNGLSKTIEWYEKSQG